MTRNENHIVLTVLLIMILLRARLVLVVSFSRSSFGGSVVRNCRFPITFPISRQVAPVVYRKTSSYCHHGCSIIFIIAAKFLNDFIQGVAENS